MGADNFLNSDFDTDEARYNRQNRLNPPEFAPGQGDDDDLFSSDFESPVQGGGMDAFMSGTDDFSNSAMNLAGAFNPPMMDTQQQQQVKSDEDKIFEVLAKVGKGIVEFFKDLISSSKDLTPKFVSVFGRNSCIASIVVASAGLLLRLFGLSIGTQLILGGIVAGIPSILLLMFFVEKGAKCSSQYKDDNTSINSNNENFSQPLDFATSESNGFDNTSDFSYDNDFDDYGDDADFGGSDDDFGGSDDDLSDSDFDWGGADDNFSTQDDGFKIQENTDVQSLVNELPDVERGMYTRKFLYDTFFKVLPSLKSDFTKVNKYDEDDDVFLSWDSIIQRAASVTGLKEEELPYLKSLEENLFTIKATINRPSKMKPDLVASEVAKAYAYSTYEEDEDRARVFAKADTVLDECIITVFTGASHKISLKDMYSKCEDFVLNSKNEIPIVLGVNEKGKVIFTDLKKVESIIIAGMPRSGKSWFVFAVLTQMCALMSPKDLHIYILDPKAKTSDYRYFRLPHVRAFASRYTDQNGNDVNSNTPSILDTLRWVVNTEAPRRKELIGGHNCVNINDFRERYPDIDLPFIYIVIDEMVTLSAMDKDDEREYQSYLDMIVTQFPNLGIRGMFIPHEVKNQIISKTAYASIKSRISVKGSPEHIEASTGTKPRAFMYKLANLGDMAVSMDTISVNTIFVHAVVLTDDNNKNTVLLDYLRRVWTKYEPDSVKGSVAEEAENDARTTELLESLDIDSDEDLEIFEDSSDSNDVFSSPNEEGVSGLNTDDFLSDL